MIEHADPRTPTRHTKVDPIAIPRLVALNELLLIVFQHIIVLLSFHFFMSLIVFQQIIGLLSFLFFHICKFLIIFYLKIAS